MLVIAWSSVGFNLPQVYGPVTAALFGVEPPPPPAAADPARPPVLGWRQAHGIAKVRMGELAAREHFAIRSERPIFYDPTTHHYDYRVLSDRDPGRTGNTIIKLDGDNGRLVSSSVPTGRAAGTTLTSWIGSIHTAGILGTPLKIALSALGIAIAGLSVRGVWLWWRKRAPRQSASGRSARRRARDPADTAPHRA